MILAALFGFALIGGAETVRVRDDRVAQAMAAAGVAAIYGALFAAVALYGMVSKPMAGIAAGALTAFAIGLSLRHGILVAALAFVGGFVSPAIIGSETPNTPVLFGYLLAIAAGTLWVIRLRGWWYLGWGVLAGSAAWTVIWMFADTSGLAWVGLFLVAVAGLFVWATWRRLAESDNPPIDVVALVWTALAATGVLLGALILGDEGRQTAGWVRSGRAWHRPLCARPLDAAVPVCRRAGAGPVAGDARTVVVRRPARRAGTVDHRVRRSLCRRRLRADVERRAARLLGGAGGGRRRWRTSCSRGGRCAPSRPARRGA